MAKWNQGQESVAQAEHISPDKTGDNIEAKKVAGYAWDGTNWQRQGLMLAPGKDFDYIGIANTATNQDTLTYKSGGSGGTTIRTLVIGYASGAEKVSDSITSLDYS